MKLTGSTKGIDRIIGLVYIDFLVCDAVLYLEDETHMVYYYAQSRKSKYGARII